MLSLLLAIIYISFISLGLPDALLGAAWPVMQAELAVPMSYAGGISLIISGGTVISSLQSDRMIKWLDTENIKENQQYLVAWHDFRKLIEQIVAETEDENTVKTITMFLLNTFFVNPYETEKEFYPQFYGRLENIQTVV